MTPPSPKSLACGALLLVAAVVPAVLTALPSRLELKRAREESLLSPAPDAETIFSTEEARLRLETDVVPFAQEAAVYASSAAPTDDAAGDRVLLLMETAAAAGATFVSAEPSGKSDREQGGYFFHAVDLKAEGSFAAIHAYLSALERHRRLIVVASATLKRDVSADRPNVLLEAQLAFAERVDAPDPETVLSTAADSRRSGR
jgi:hypothetical protein